MTDHATRAARLVEVLCQLEDLVRAVPAGRRREAAIELVVTRVRRLRTGRGGRTTVPREGDPQLDLERILAARSQRSR